MKYYEKIVQPGEVVKFVGKLHWVVFLRAWLLLFFGIASGAVSQLEPTTATFMAPVAIAFLAVGILFLLIHWIVRVTTEIVVTDQRIIHKRGLISRRTEEMNISKVETVDVNQGIWGRMLGFGTLIIRGTGGGLEPLTRIASPLAIRNAIMIG